jgi:hypothetical protein
VDRAFGESPKAARGSRALPDLIVVPHKAEMEISALGQKKKENAQIQSGAELKIFPKRTQTDSRMQVRPSPPASSRPPAGCQQTIPSHKKAQEVTKKHRQCIGTPASACHPSLKNSQALLEGHSVHCNS